MTPSPVLPLASLGTPSASWADRARSLLHSRRRGPLTLLTKLVLGLLIAISLLLLIQDRSQVRFTLPSLPKVPSLSNGLKSSADTSTKAGLDKRPRVFDIILLNGELNLLDIRLNELHNQVDYFVILESGMTFSGKPKPLHFRINENRYKAFRRQILHVVIPTADLGNPNNAWEVEKMTRDVGFWTALDIHRPAEGDFLILSDLDEVPRQSIVQAMKDQSWSTSAGRLFGDGTLGTGGDLFRLGCQFYYYSYEFRHKGPLWVGPVVVRYREADSPALAKQTSDEQVAAMQELSKNDWKTAGEALRNYRNKQEATYVDDACIHCSWCFANISQVKTKVESYSHAEHNQDRYKERQWILDRYSQGLDLFEREWDTFDYIENNADVPVYVGQNPDKYSYLLARHGRPNAGFMDVDPANPLGEQIMKDPK